MSDIDGVSAREIYVDTATIAGNQQKDTASGNMGYV